jgi:hypothetical protein
MRRPGMPECPNTIYLLMFRLEGFIDDKMGHLFYSAGADGI